MALGRSGPANHEWTLPRAARAIWAEGVGNSPRGWGPAGTYLNRGPDVPQGESRSPVDFLAAWPWLVRGRATRYDPHGGISRRLSHESNSLGNPPRRRL